jgi:hypothetical protein
LVEASVGKGLFVWGVSVSFPTLLED